MSEEEFVACDRCTTPVDPDTLLTAGNWRVCEDCWDDL